VQVRIHPSGTGDEYIRRSFSSCNFLLGLIGRVFCNPSSNVWAVRIDSEYLYVLSEDDCIIHFTGLHHHLLLNY